jgi:DNA ligase (NAD+)
VQLVSTPGFGNKRVQNILDAIEASKKVPVHALLLALGIAGVGSVTAQLLLQHCGGTILVRALVSFLCSLAGVKLFRTSFIFSAS